MIVLLTKSVNIIFFPPYASQKNKNTPCFCIISADETSWQEKTFPLNVLGAFGESLMTSLRPSTPVITISQKNKQRLLNMGFAEADIHLLPRNNYKPWPKQDIKKKQHNFIVVSTGQMSQERGTEDIIEAFAAFHTFQPKSELWLVGNCPKDYQEKIYDILNFLDIEKAVRFYDDTIPEKTQKVLSKAHCLVIASPHEELQYSIAEANAVGTITISYYFDHLTEVLEHLKTGIFCEENDPHEIEKHLLSIAQNSEFYNMLSRNAHKKSHQHYQDDSIQKTDQALQKIIGRANSW